MARYVNKVFENTTVKLDGNEYIDCVMKNCRVEYSGTNKALVLDGTDLSGCQFAFLGNAAPTWMFIKSLYQAAPQEVLNLLNGPIEFDGDA